ncbi:MAG: undecaprenyl/decaprenyl-phosphate alpha-N-acetylglucosaminyl 1-phosphate transferase [Thiovulaceae bacterium]|nr:undecaprenyl/decaprenyl-phosphate alpha-N-acetylglucosaminyl 1-phosphate transferase [Sulfurimonadaceae bacterium]
MRNAEKFGLMDIPNERSTHKEPIPRAAGVGFISAVLIISLLFNFTHFVEYYYIYLSIFIIFFVGVLDDKRGVSPLLKFLFIFVATLILYLNDFDITSLGSYLGYEVTLPLVLVLPFTFFAVAGFTNAFNLLDGLDGLAGAVSMVMLSAFLAIGILYNDILIITLSSLFLVAVSTFLLFNWYPARIFMGDSGSLSLGFVISILSIQSMAYLAPSAVLFIIALPILDTLNVMTRRIQRGGSPFQADKNHMHHFLYRANMDVKFTDILIVYIQIAFSIIGYQLRDTDNLLNLILFGILFYIFFNLLDQRIRHRHKS